MLLSPGNPVERCRLPVDFCSNLAYVSLVSVMILSAQISNKSAKPPVEIRLYDKQIQHVRGSNKIGNVQLAVNDRKWMVVNIHHPDTKLI